MDIVLQSDWKHRLCNEFEQSYFKELDRALTYAYKTREIFPPEPLIFNALNHCPFETVKVVILGQDPYHGPDQAHGLAFSVPDGIAIPPSLRNIFQEIVSDVGGTIPTSGNLEHWATQGVLLLNTTLTVEPGEAGSHAGWGWEQFTDQIIRTIATEKNGVVFLLWGKHAQSKSTLIDANRHLLLEAPHPSPLSVHRGFFGSKHFSQTNQYLISQSLPPINWLP